MCTDLDVWLKKACLQNCTHPCSNMDERVSSQAPGKSPLFFKVTLNKVCGFRGYDCIYDTSLLIISTVKIALRVIN